MAWKRQKTVIYSRTRTKIQRTYNSDTWRKALHRIFYRMFNKKGKTTENQATYFSDAAKPVTKDRGMSVIYINDSFLQPINSEHIQIAKGLEIDEIIEKFGLDEGESRVLRNMFRDYSEEVPLTGLGGHVKSSDKLGKRSLAEMLKGYRERLMKNRILSMLKYQYYKEDEDDIILPIKSKSSGRLKDMFGWPLDDTNIPNKLHTSFISRRKEVDMHSILSAFASLYN